MSVLFQKTRRNPDYCVRCYLTLRCGSQCEFCSAQIQQAPSWRQWCAISPKVWAEGLNRRARHAVLAGGEPFLYPHFAELIGLIEPGYKVEIYTNLQHDVGDFLEAAKQPYSFLVSLHPSTKDLPAWFSRVEQLAEAGHGLRFHIVRSGDYQRLQQLLIDSGIIGRFRTALQGDQRAGPKSQGQQSNAAHPWVRCTSRIYLFGPDGFRYHCVHKLVFGDSSGRWEHISLPDEEIETRIYCQEFGLCAGCDNNIEGSVEHVEPSRG